MSTAKDSAQSQSLARTQKLKRWLLIAFAVLSVGPFQVLFAYFVDGMSGVNRALWIHAFALLIAVPAMAAFFLAGCLERAVLRRCPRMSRFTAATLILLPMIILGTGSGIRLAVWVFR